RRTTDYRQRPTVVLDEAPASEEPLKAVRNCLHSAAFQRYLRMACVDGEDSPPDTSSPPRAIGHPCHLDADVTAVSRQAQKTTSHSLPAPCDSDRRMFEPRATRSRTDHCRAERALRGARSRP